MSELMNVRNNSRDLRWRLLTTASALALLAAVYGTNESEAADQDADRPTVWIELGGQLERMSGSEEAFSPPFMASITQANLLSALDVQKPPAFAIGEEGKISFQPENSDWVFSASIQYGRSSANTHRHQQTANAKVPVAVPFPPAFHRPSQYLIKGTYYPNLHSKFADGQASERQSHLVLDFQAGKDVGLGLFGGHGSSVVSAGVRIVQFTSQKNVSLNALPDLQYPTAPITGTFYKALSALYAFRDADPKFHAYSAMINSQRSFHGVGPSLAWSASAPFAGSLDRGELSFDWGVNGAVLFGRQKASGHHKSKALSYHMTMWRGGDEADQQFTNLAVANHPTPYGHEDYSYTPHATGHRANVAGFNRSRSVVVPNLGGFAGISFQYSSAKVSFGYRADFFFGAMDGGIDTRQTEDRGFFGPFATISIGLGG